MQGLREFIQRHRNFSIAVGAMAAVALIGCCLVGIFADTAEGPAPTEEERSAAVAAEATDTPLAIEEPTNTPESTVTPEPTDTPQPTDTPEPTDTSAPTDTPTPAPTATSEPSPTPAQVQAQVVEVVDGDTIRVNIAGDIYSLRYIGIDAPEPGEWMGPEAAQANTELVGGKTVYLEKDVSETDQYGRLLRYVFLVDGAFVNAELVRWRYALARAYPPDVKYQGLLVAMEEEARDNERGLPGAAPTPIPPTSVPPTGTAPAAGQAQVVVDPSCCQFDSPGNDNYTKEQEYVCFANRGDGDADMSGWTMRDEYGWTYTLPGFVLPAGARVRVATGCGVNTNDMLFWCKDGTAVWNTGGDTVFLYDSGGAFIATYSY